MSPSQARGREEGSERVASSPGDFACNIKSWEIERGSGDEASERERERGGGREGEGEREREGGRKREGGTGERDYAN